MIVAFVSGSFQTGRSTIAANLANYLRKTISVTLLDSDIEQLESSILLPPIWSKESEITVLSPIHDLDACQHCLSCITKCKSSVFKDYKDKIILLTELCSHCGDCVKFCKGHAVKLQELTIGTIHKASYNNLTVLEVRLNDSAVKANSLFYHTKSYLDPLDVTLVDAAPYISDYACCSTMGADYFVVVTGDNELHFKQLKRTLNFFNNFKKPYGVLVNLSESENNQTAEYCKNNNIPLLGVLPFDKKLESGEIPRHQLVESPRWHELFASLWEKIQEELSQ